MTKGQGSYVWDKEGKKYLDFYGGHAVCILGHCPKPVADALKEQSEKLIFYSNIFATEPSQELADILTSTLKPSHYQAYFTNSGSEANEAAIKIARKHTGKNQIISFKNSFHGRSITCIAATGINYYHQFKPNLDQHTTFAELGNIASVKELVTKDTAAVICEPIQSIGGVNVAEKEFYQELSKLCAEKNILLIFDEVQTGLGRTGDFWFAQAIGIEPDIITTAKGIASGLPISAVLIKESIATKINTGEHATTFGGGPLVCSAAIATIKTLLDEKIIESVSQKEQLIRENISLLPQVEEITGKGLLLGIHLNVEAKPIVKEALNKGLIIGGSITPNTIRIMPPLNISEKEIEKFIKLFAEILISTSND